MRMILETLCGVQRDQTLVIGFSGGADSTALLLILKKLGYPIIAAHFNHQLRDSASADADIAREIAARIGVPFQLGIADVKKFAREHGYSIEDAARKARYQFLFSCARNASAQAVAVGHHANDQIETVLMNFLRGAGLDGLTGMPYRSIIEEWDHQIPVVRPLLSVWRDELEDLCAEEGIRPAEDPTNQETVYARNRVRLELLPALEQYNPSIREAIWRTADILRADAEDLQKQDESAWLEICESVSVGLVRLNYPRLRALSKGSLRRQLRRAIETIRPGLKDFDFATLQRAANFVRTPTRSRKMDLAAGLEIRVDENSMLIRAYGTNLPECGLGMPEGVNEIEVSVPGVVLLKRGMRLCCDWVTQDAAQSFSSNKWESWFDADKLDFPLVVRARKPGDRIYLYGMNGQSQKISDLMMNEKIAARLRGRWPLVCTQSEILWAPGMRRSDQALVDESSTRLIRFWLESSDNYSDSSSSTD